MKKETKQQSVIAYFLGLGNSNLEVFHSIRIVKYGDCNMIAFSCGNPRSFSHLHFKSDEQREQYISDLKSSEQKDFDRKTERLAKCEKKKELFTVGAILYSSWGWEQTNIDFYTILERKNDFVTLQKIGQNVSYSPLYGDRGTCTADPEVKIGDPFRKKITKHASINLNSYSYCSLWDGFELYWSSYA